MPAGFQSHENTWLGFDSVMQSYFIWSNLSEISTAITIKQNWNLCFWKQTHCCFFSPEKHTIFVNLAQKDNEIYYEVHLNQKWNRIISKQFMTMFRVF